MNEKINYRTLLIREFLGLSKKVFSENLSINQSNYSQIEKGERKININHLINLVNIYNVNVNWLLTGDGEMFNIIRREMITDDSMLPHLNRGDVILCQPSDIDDIENGYIYLIITKDDLKYIKEVYLRNNELLLKSISIDNQLFTIKKTEIKSVWKAIKKECKEILNRPFEQNSTHENELLQQKVDHLERELEILKRFVDVLTKKKE